VVVVSDLSLEQPKTKILAKAVAQFGSGGQVLIVASDVQSSLWQAAKNLAGVKVVSPDHLNVYDVVRAQVVVIPERELARVKEVWS
jgi:large subunit ribosomal protein L4